MIVHVTLLFILGISLGWGIGHLAGARTHLMRFNNVAVAIVGALIGGFLPQAILGHGNLASGIEFSSFISAAIVATLLLAIMIGLRRALDA
jgi:uncharacterized membrane protein YeaQ/YmgE (transglycosylase-associated protein family)